MKAILFDGVGDAGVLRLADEPIPQIRPHDLLVRVHAAGVNRADILQREGVYGARPDYGDSLLPGLEIAGEVAAVGPQAEGWSRWEFLAVRKACSRSTCSCNAISASSARS